MSTYLIGWEGNPPCESYAMTGTPIYSEVDVQGRDPRYWYGSDLISKAVFDNFVTGGFVTLLKTPVKIKRETPISNKILIVGKDAPHPFTVMVQLHIEDYKVSFYETVEECAKDIECLIDLLFEDFKNTKKIEKKTLSCAFALNPRNPKVNFMCVASAESDSTALANRRRARALIRDKKDLQVFEGLLRTVVY